MGGPQFTLVDACLRSSSRGTGRAPMENHSAAALAVAPPRGRRTSAPFTRFGGFSFACAALIAASWRSPRQCPDDDPLPADDRQALRALASPQQRLPAEVRSEPGAARRVPEVPQLGYRRARESDHHPSEAHGRTHRDRRGLAGRHGGSRRRRGDAAVTSDYLRPLPRYWSMRTVAKVSAAM